MWKQYRDSNLLESLKSLHNKIQSGSYKALANRRVWIPKENGEKRGLGVTALEDKIVQKALVWVLEAIYETDFAGFSYGFRPGRSQHNALDALTVAIKCRKVNWIIDADVRKFFDKVDHDFLMKFLSHRIQDSRVLRLIRKWLKAGVMDNNKLYATDVGTPQGAVISPLLANIFLHYVLDLWIHSWRKQYATGQISIVRYADDFVLGCEKKTDAVKLNEALNKRFNKFKLELHPEKTRLIKFGRFARIHAIRDNTGRPDTFDFLGFTHICSYHQKNGKFKLLRISRKDRFRASLRAIKKWLRINMHKPVPEQGAYLRRVVQGWLNYHAIPGNSKAISSFHHHIGVLWYRALRRRSHKARSLKWDRMNRYINRWFPKAIILHPYPEDRFASQT